MTCSSCGAEVSALDTTCRVCGAELRVPARVSFGPVIGNSASDGEGVPTAEVPSPNAVPPTPPAPTIGATTAPARKRADRSTKILAIVTGVAILLAIGVGVSRTQVSSKLARTEADVANSSSQLAVATARADSLEQRLGDLEVATQQLQSKLGDAQAKVADTDTSLAACQVLFRVGAKYSNGTQVPPSVAVRMASKLASCFQGGLPPSIHG